MKQFLSFVKKEFYHIFRDRRSIHTAYRRCHRPQSVAYANRLALLGFALFFNIWAVVSYKKTN
ncbi:hypothetical protein [Dysgonomonas sp. 521]|uniref:hypothetical protein n=1 Tax=Dysgonomonas sp. 521 TaxID=2302932 RepID=UPI0013D74DB6|nr:hypothetical protein [Dysgonomonas sp. 521]